MSKFEFAFGREFGGERLAEGSKDGGFFIAGEMELARAESMHAGILGGVGFAGFSARPGGAEEMGSFGQISATSES